MLTGMLAVRNLVLGATNDLWSVNTEQEYHEEIRVYGEADADQVVEGVLAQAFPKLDRLSFGISLGAVSGVMLFLATLVLVLNGGEVIGPNLQLLRQYFPGYSVTMFGSVLGLAYGFASGFVAGWGFAFLRNAAVFLCMAAIHRRAEYELLRRLLGYF